MCDRFSLCVFALTAVAAPALRAAKPAESVMYLKQNWSAEERRQFYNTPQGSLLIPYSWFLHLEQATNDKPFRSDENMERFHYLRGTHDPKHNPDTLPVGFAREPPERVRNEKANLKYLRAFMRKGGKLEDFPASDVWLGLTCAACHTTQIESGGKKLRIDGAPAMADFNRFIRSLSQAVEAALEEKPKFTHLADKVLGPRASDADRALLRRQVAEYSAALALYRDRNSPPFAHGPGRLDAFALIMNEVFGTALNIPANYRPNDAPVSYPALWNTPDLDWVQWNGSASNPFGRNVGEVFGVFGHADVTEPSAKGFHSSVRGENLHNLEKLIAKVTPPAWDEATLGKIDQEKKKRGALVYEAAGCAKCHGNQPPYPRTDPNQAQKTFIKTTMVPLKEIGTDPKMATNFATREAFPGIFGQPNDPPGKALPLLSQFVAQVTVRQFVELKLTTEQKQEYSGFRTGGQPPNVLAYKARPLSGVWATAPYLHNGSVPNLYELLQSPAERERTFYIGSRKFDTEKVGFKTEKLEGGFLFDTSLPGNSNAGHYYGSERSKEEREDLIEYLKTL